MLSGILKYAIHPLAAHVFYLINYLSINYLHGCRHKREIQCSFMRLLTGHQDGKQQQEITTNQTNELKNVHAFKDLMAIS